MYRRGTVVILLGPPGSGKGTQGAILAAAVGIPTISTGEILRREFQSGSALGAEVQNLLAAGQLVGDHLMNEVVARRLREPDCLAGCILDGYPRTIAQARFLDSFLPSAGFSQPKIFDFVVSPEEVIARLSHRRQCPTCGRIFSAEFDVYGKDTVCDRDNTPLVRRADDNPESIRERLRIYAGNAAGLVRFYETRDYHPIHAMRSPDEISEELRQLLLGDRPKPLGLSVLATIITGA